MTEQRTKLQGYQERILDLQGETAGETKEAAGNGNQTVGREKGTAGVCTGDERTEYQRQKELLAGLIRRENS